MPMLRHDRAEILIADPLIGRIAGDTVKRKLILPHTPISKRLLPCHRPSMFGQELLDWLADELTPGFREAGGTEQKGGMADLC